MNKTLSYILLLSVFFTSCRKKELPVQDSQDPVFYLNYTLDGNDQRIEAGNYDYFMNTSWSQDSSLKFYLKGDLSQTSSASSRAAGISILVHDTKISSATSAMKVDSILILGQHLLNDKTIFGTTQSILFKPDRFFDTNTIYQWEITDGNADQRSVTNYSFAADFTIGKTYTVSLKSDEASGNCTITHTNVFRVGSKLQTKIIAKRDSSTPEFRYIFSYPVPYAGNFKCEWKFFADGSTSTLKNPPPKLFLPSIASVVRLMLIDLNTSDTCFSYYQLNTTNNACDANYAASFTPVINSNIYATATVLYTDVDGTVYSSRNVIQPTTSNFEILSVSDYKNNANGSPTKSLNVKFNCVLINGNRQISLTNANGVIAVAYKP